MAYPQTVTFRKRDGTHIPVTAGTTYTHSFYSEGGTMTYDPGIPTPTPEPEPNGEPEGGDEGDAPEPEAE